jgi:thiamine pyrophosphate-dependent acetolactate synthase large subunit-like protein
MGCTAARVERAAELAPVLREAIGAPTPFLVDVVVTA